MFKRVVAQNFLSWSELKFDFSPGVTLIEGFNYDDQTSEGSGKSAILNALCWGLYGRIPKDANISDVIRDGSRGCAVTVVLEGDTKIVRTRGPNNLYIQYTEGGEQFKGKDARETQTLIENLIGLSFEAFLQAVYWAQNYNQKFVTATEEEKGKILSEILNLKQFDKARTLTTAKLREVDAASAGAEKQLSDVDLHLLSVDRQIADFEFLRDKQVRERQERVRRLEAERAGLVSELHALETDLQGDEATQIETERTKIAEFIDEVTRLSQEVRTKIVLARQRKELVSEINYTKSQLGTLPETLDDSEIAAQLVEVRSDIEELRGQRAETQATFQDIARQKKLRDDLIKSQARKDKEIKELQNNLRFLLSPEGQKCPTCGNELSGEKDVCELKETISQTEARLASALEERAAVTRDLEGVVVLSDAQVAQQVAFIEEGLKAAQAQERSLDAQLKAIATTKSEYAKKSSRLTFLEESLAKFGEYQETALDAELKTFSDCIDDAKEKDLELAKTLTLHERRVGEFRAKQAVLAKLEADLAREADTGTSHLEEKLKLFAQEKEQWLRARSNAEGEVAAIREHRNRLQTLKDGFREIKAYVFQNILGELTRKANAYLVELFEIPTTISFSNVSEDGEVSKIQVEVMYGGATRPLGLYSGGQFRRIQLAVDLALSEIVSARGAHPMRLRILDEYFKDLSLSSMQKALGLLEKLNGTTVLIEHNELFKTVVTKTFQVELRDGVSREAA